jgi:hypothetical protein
MNELERLREMEKRLLETLKVKREDHDEMFGILQRMSTEDYSGQAGFDMRYLLTQNIVEVTNLAYYLDFDLENSIGFKH